MAEYIYNLLPQEKPQPDSKLKYTSVHAEHVKKEMDATKSPGKLFGPGSCKPDPKNFTRKGKGATIKANAAPGPQRTDLSTIPATILAPSVQPRPDLATIKYVPRASERPTIAPKSNKNFIKTNILESTKRTPSKSTPQRTHNRGEVPKYLTKRKEETARAKEMANELYAQQEENSKLQQLSAEEREDILNGLKANYQELYKNYLSLSMVTDTIPKRNTKNSMEAKLAELEADIAKLERHEVILIA